MDMPDLNHTLLLIIAVLVSLTRLVRLLFVTLRVCVKEYCKFRNWLHAYVRRHTTVAKAGPTPPALHARPGGDERDHEREEREQRADEEGAGHHTFERGVVCLRGEAGNEPPAAGGSADTGGEGHDNGDAEPSPCQA